MSPAFSILIVLTFLIETFPLSVEGQKRFWQKSADGEDKVKRSVRDTKTFLTSGSESRRHWYTLFKFDFHLENLSEEELNRLLVLFRYAKHILKQVSPELLRAAKLMDLCLSSSTRNNSECKERDFTLLYLLPLNTSLPVPDHEMFGLLLKLITLLHQDYPFSEEYCQKGKMKRLAKGSAPQNDDHMRGCLKAIANSISEMRVLHKEFHRLIPKRSDTIDVYHKKGTLKQLGGRLANVFSGSEDRKLKLERVMMTSAFNMIELWFYYGTEEELRGSRKLEQEEAEQAAVKLIIEKIKKKDSIRIDEWLFLSNTVASAIQQDALKDRTTYTAAIEILKKYVDKEDRVTPWSDLVVKDLIDILGKVTLKGHSKEEGTKLVTAMTTCITHKIEFESLKIKYTNEQDVEDADKEKVTDAHTKLSGQKTELGNLINNELDDVIAKVETLKSIFVAGNNNKFASGTTFDDSLTGLTSAINGLLDAFNNLPFVFEAN